MTTKRFAVVGLPSTGKTTFLAALWHLIGSGKKTRTRLALHRLDGDSQYLNGLLESWLRCREVSRTSGAHAVEVTMHVRDTQSGEAAVLSFPDLSGETFERQFATRVCSRDYLEGARTISGILLFISANIRHGEGTTIAELEPILAGADEANRKGQPKDWSPGAVPEQVRLVDLLQFLQFLPFQQTKRRVAVIVSAWDLVDKVSPAEWLAREMPLLTQFLTTNHESLEFQAYGVSAQGGDFAKSRDALLRVDPADRVICSDDKGTSHDITGPIVWLVNRG